MANSESAVGLVSCPAQGSRARCDGTRRPI